MIILWGFFLLCLTELVHSQLPCGPTRQIIEIERNVICKISSSLRDFIWPPCRPDLQPTCEWPGISCVDTRFGIMSAVVREIDTSVRTLGSGERKNFSGVIPSDILLLQNLETLKLAHGTPEGPLPDFSRLTRLTSLTLNLYRSGNLPSFLFGSSKLVLLDLAQNDFNGTIPSSISRMTSLKTLRLNQNAFSGKIPPLNMLTNLTTVNLADNAFDGFIPPLPKSLKVLFLQNNLLAGDIRDLKNYVNLSDVGLSYNNFTGTLQYLAQSTRLITLSANNNNFNGPIPNFVSPDLATLNLQDNRLIGTIPPFTTRLKLINLGSNQLTGTIPTSMRNLIILLTLDLSWNKLTGEVPTFTPLMQNLLLHHNQLSGNLTKMVTENYLILGTLDVRANNFSGSVPPFWGAKRLERVNLGSNQLTGTIPQPNKLGLAKSPIKELILADNDLTGDIPREVVNYPKLTFLDVSQNRLDTFCKEIGTIYVTLRQFGPDLKSLYIHSNKILKIHFSFRKFKDLEFLMLFDNYINHHHPIMLDDNRGISAVLDPQNPYCANSKECDEPEICQNHLCVCPEGYEEDRPCTDINECLTGQSIGKNSTVALRGRERMACERKFCVNMIGGFACCPSGYFNPRLETTHPAHANPVQLLESCEDINECVEGTSTCPPLGTSQTCVNTVGSFLCCPPGYMNPFPSKTGTIASCEDVNECIQGTSSISSAKSINTNRSCERSSCVNTFGSFYCCPGGYKNDDAFRTSSTGSDPFSICQDINECVLGTSISGRSINTNSTCERKQCVNMNGTFFCCPQGYDNPDTGMTSPDGSSGCQDRDECVLKEDGCNASTYCQNLIGGFRCDPCHGIGEPQPDPQKAKMFKEALSQYPHSFDFHTCFGPCEAGVRVVAYPEKAAKCSVGADISSILCSYACTNKTAQNTEVSAIATLYGELQRGNFISDIIGKIWKANVSFSMKRANSITMAISPCPSDVTQLQALLSSVAREIVPNAPGLETSVDSNCQATFVAKDPSYTGMIIGIVIAVVLILVIIFLVIFIRYYLQSELQYLPSAVAWSYQQYKRNPIGWEYRGSSKSGYHYKDLDEGDESYTRAVDLLKNFESSKGKLAVKSVTAVYNPVLVRNFVGNYQIAVSRSTQEIFTTKTWQEQSQVQRDFVHEQYKKVCGRYEWNKKNDLSAIIPMLHGTDLLVAEKICENGFAALSSIDAGYFGKGIYFTNHMLYTLPYIALRSKPVILLSWVVPGNVYPVIEAHNGPNSLLGSAIKSGYSSHYILTNSQGFCLQQQETEFYDELVVSQESQIAPAYIFEIAKNNLKKLLKEWDRAVPETQGNEEQLPTDLLVF